MTGPANGMTQSAKPEDTLATLCRVCGTRGLFARFELREMLFGTRERFRYERCPRCGVLQISSVPADLSRHYPPEYYERIAPEEVPTEPATDARPKLATRLKGAVAARVGTWIRKQPPEQEAGEGSWIRDTVDAAQLQRDDAVLDVGCGRRPTFLLELRSLGFTELDGIDPFLEGDSSYEGIRLFKRSIHEHHGGYKLITLHHSLEHMPDPVDVMRAARRLLSETGTIVVRIPVMGTWFWETFGTNWWELDPPRHLFIHTVDSLLVCARAAGVRLVQTTWESSFVEVVASRQIAQDIAWYEPGSWAIDPPAGVTESTEASYRSLVEDLNRQGQAGRAAFFFRVASAQ